MDPQATAGGPGRGAGMNLPNSGDQSFPDDVCSRCRKPISMTAQPVLLMPVYTLDGEVDLNQSFRYHPYCVRVELLQEIQECEAAGSPPSLPGPVRKKAATAGGNQSESAEPRPEGA